MKFKADEIASVLQKEIEDFQGQIQTAEVGGWYDCGTLEAIIETNETLLRQGAARRPSLGSDVTVHEPVYIEDGARIERSVIGPNVSIENGTTVADSRLSHTIVGRECELRNVRLTRTMLGNHVRLREAAGSASLGDHAEFSGVTE